MAKESGVDLHQGTMGEHSLTGYGPVVFAKRPVRCRLQGVVGRGREKIPLTRLVFYLSGSSGICALCQTAIIQTTSPLIL
jgi:LSD1 subclass zinc finger protein